MQETLETRVWSLGGEDPLEKEMARSSILALKMLWTEEPGRLQSMELQSRTRLHAHTCPARPASNPRLFPEARVFFF